jgi:hypothetical protein
MKITTKFYKIILKACIILFIIGFSTQRGISSKTDTTVHQQKEEIHNQHALEVGKRLFHGLIKTGEKTVDCGSCHYTNKIDTLNWNPSALAIAKSTDGMDSSAFASTLFSPITEAGMKAHEGIDLTGKQMEQIRIYLDHIKEVGLKEEKPVVTELLTFIGLILLLLLTVADLAFFKKIKKTAVHFLLMTGSAIGIVMILYTEAVAIDRMPGYEPLQPIKFSHKVHAKDNQIDCQYCHNTAEHSKSAGIPGPGLCINCHEVVMEGTNSGEFEINKIKQALKDSVPIRWVRVHQLPDHVFFSHEQHVKVGELDCQECHGHVEDMHVLKQHTDLSMGWCLECHRTRKVNMMENSYYKNHFEEFHKQIMEGKMDSVTVDQIGGIDCMKCHY